MVQSVPSITASVHCPMIDPENQSDEEINHTAHHGADHTNGGTQNASDSGTHHAERLIHQIFPVNRLQIQIIRDIESSVRLKPGRNLFQKNGDTPSDHAERLSQFRNDQSCYQSKQRKNQQNRNHDSHTAPCLRHNPASGARKIKPFHPNEHNVQHISHGHSKDKRKYDVPQVRNPADQLLKISDAQNQ